MTAILSTTAAQGKKQRAFILLPVVITLVILAAIAYLLSRQGAINAGNVNREHQQDTALYVAQAGYHHAIWQLNQQNCTGYTDIPTTSIGDHTYLTSYTDITGASLTAGSPANIKVVSTLANGTSYTLSRYREKIYQYPLTTVTLQLGTDPGKDVMIDSFYNNRNHGDYKQGVSSDTGWMRHQLIQFDLSSIPTEANIVLAQLELKQISTNSAQINAKIDVYREKQSWVEGTKPGGGLADGATWDTADGSLNWDDASGGSYDTTSIASTDITGANVLRNWDITTLVQGWHKGQHANEGLLLKGSGTVNVEFASKEYATAANRPKLTITYSCECGKSCGVVGPPPPAKKVYWTDDFANKIQRSDEDGSNVEEIITGLNRPTGLDIDSVNGKLYWTNGLQIQRANLNGSSIETIYSGSANTFDIKLDITAGKMYWTHDSGVDLVMRATLDGSNSETLNTSLDGASYITLDTTAGHIYLTSFGDGSVSRMNVDGSNIITLVTGSSGPVGNAIDSVNGKIYWTGGATNDWIKRANLDGSSIETIVTGLNAPQDIVYDTDNNRIYWVDALNILVQRSNSDGTNMETIVSTGMTRPRGITLVNADEVPSTCNGTFRDEFNAISFAGNDGTLTWKGDWLEVGESDGPSSRDVAVINDISNYQLQLQDNDNGGEGVEREANLSGATSATLSLLYRREGLDDVNDKVTIWISPDGAAGPWSELIFFAGDGSDSNYVPFNVDISSFISANTRIRLLTSATMGRNDAVYFDDIQIQCSP